MRMLTYFPFIFILFIIRAEASTGQLENGRIRSSSRVSASSPSSLPSAQRSLPAMKIDTSGKVYVTQILKQQLANELGLHLRDLRIVDPSLPTQIKATFTSRRKAILFCIENIKVVVQHDEALVFGLYQPEVQEFIPALQQQIAQATAGEVLLAGSARFEHIVLEAALNVVCSNLLRRVRALSPAVTSALKDLKDESRGLEVMQTQVDTLIPLKNKIDELRKRVKEIKRAINDILENDEDMSMMYLTPHSDSELKSIEMNTNTKIDGVRNAIPSVVDTMDLEMLFETYLNEIEWISSEVEEVIDEITNTEENVVLQLNILQNRILRFELSLSMSSFVVTCGALITGLFGMNLIRYVHTSILSLAFLFSICTFPPQIYSFKT
jgi:magnesium transporter